MSASAKVLRLFYRITSDVLPVNFVLNLLIDFTYNSNILAPKEIQSKRLDNDFFARRKNSFFGFTEYDIRSLVGPEEAASQGAAIRCDDEYLFWKYQYLCV